jgi:hypothetical protein
LCGGYCPVFLQLQDVWLRVRLLFFGSVLACFLLLVPDKNDIQKTPFKVKQPTPLWQVISICVTIILAGIAGLVSTNTKISRLETEINNLKDNQFNMQLSTDRKFDKIDSKIDGIQSDTRQILINLERKADRK